MSFELPKSLREASKKGMLIGVIQFGSSLYAEKEAGDIDLVVVVKYAFLKKFLGLIENDEYFGFDISLVLERELGDLNRFRFGSHGIHLLKVFSQGKLLLGTNPFLGAPEFPKKEIRESILERLYDYLYLLRKSYFDQLAYRQVQKRWQKFVRLALFLLDDTLEFPKVLQMSVSEVRSRYFCLDIDVYNGKIQENFEIIWQKIIEKSQSW